jgi:hypothetical protein
LEALTVARKLVCPELRDDRIGNARHNARAKLINIEPRELQEDWPRRVEERRYAIEQEVFKAWHGSRGQRDGKGRHQRKIARVKQSHNKYGQ